MTTLRRRWSLLTPLLAVVSVLAAGLVSAAPVSAAAVTRTASTPAGCSSSFAAVVAALQPENRVKGFLAADPLRTGVSTSVSPNRVRGFDLFLRSQASGVTVYVNGDPVNLSDPNGHMACADQGCQIYAQTRPGVVTNPVTAIHGEVGGFINEVLSFARNQVLDQYIVQYQQQQWLTQLASAREWGREDASQLHACGQDVGNPCSAEVWRNDSVAGACDLAACIADFLANHKMDALLTAATALIEWVPGVGEAADVALGARYASEGGELATEGSSALVDASNAAFKAADNAGDFSVALKHLFGSAGRWAKFGDGVDATSAIAEALRSEGAVFSPNNIDGAFRVTTDLGRAIGSNGQTGIRVVVGDDGSIWTAFPVNP